MLVPVTNWLYRNGGARYRQIAARIRQKIMTGSYPPGSALPSIGGLAAEFDVGRDTVVDALGVLREAGLVVTRQGFRARVRSQPDRVAVAGLPGDEIIARTPQPGEVEQLNLDPGVPVVEIRRIGCAVGIHAADSIKVTVAVPNGAKDS